MGSTLGRRSVQVVVVQAVVVSLLLLVVGVVTAAAEEKNNVSWSISGVIEFVVSDDRDLEGEDSVDQQSVVMDNPIKLKMSRFVAKLFLKLDEAKGELSWTQEMLRGIESVVLEKGGGLVTMAELEEWNSRVESVLEMVHDVAMEVKVLEEVLLTLGDQEGAAVIRRLKKKVKRALSSVDVIITEIGDWAGDRLVTMVELLRAKHSQNKALKKNTREDDEKLREKI